MKCQPCGQDNAATALFCTACRRPLVAPSKLPTRIEPLAAPAMAAPAMAPAYGGAAETPSSRNRFAPPNAGASGYADRDSQVITREEAWAAVIGSSNTEHYLERFERMANGEGGGWHWPALFVTWFWMLYRKMWVPALLYFFAPYIFFIATGVVMAAAPAVGGLLIVGWWAGTFIVPGLMANGWYYNHCKKKIRDVRARGGSKDQMLARMEAAGGTSNILVIILAVLGISMGIGILAAVALPAYQTYTFKAKVSEAVPVANDVAAAVGDVYAQTGQLPSQSDVDGMLARAPHQSKYVKGIELDDTSGKLAVRVSLSPQVSGTLQMTPGVDNARHLSWTCTTDDLKRFAPPSCRSDDAAR